MIILNPTDKEISVSIEGITYTVAPLGEISSVPVEHAMYWQTKLHNFIKIKDEVKKISEKIKEVIEEKVDKSK